MATNNLNYSIRGTFNNSNRRFVLAFENEQDKKSYFKYYTPTVEIKDYKVLIDLDPFYEKKNKEETYKKAIELIRRCDYTTGNLLDYDYFANHYKLFVVGLPKIKI